MIFYGWGTGQETQSTRSARIDARRTGAVARFRRSYGRTSAWTRLEKAGSQKRIDLYQSVFRALSGQFLSYSLPQNEGKLGQEYCRLFFSILLIEAPNSKDKIGYG